MTMMTEWMAMINDDGINGGGNGILQQLCIEKRPEPSQSRNPPVSMMSNDEQWWCDAWCERCDVMRMSEHLMHFDSGLPTTTEKRDEHQQKREHLPPQRTSLMTSLTLLHLIIRVGKHSVDLHEHTTQWSWDDEQTEKQQRWMYVTSCCACDD